MTSTVEVARPAKQEKAKPSALRRVAIVLVAIVAVLAVAYGGISAYVADKVSRPQRKTLATTPTAYGLKYEDVQFPSAVDGISLKGWFIDSSGNKTIVLIHGRNGTRADESIGMMDLAKGLVGRGYDVLTFDFRAHGESGGQRYSLGDWEVRDIAGALDYLKGRGVSQVGTVGFSMGAATEILAAPDHPEMRAIVADAPFADLSLLLDVQLPKSSGLPTFFNPGALFMVQTMYGVNVMENKPERAMARLDKRPLLLIHGTDDELVPVEHAYILQKAAAKNPSFETWIVPGSRHVQSFKDHPQDYLTRVTAFFDRNLQ